MTNNNATNFTTVASDSGSAVMATGTQTGFTLSGASGVTTSASGSTITITGSGAGAPVQQIRSSTSTAGSTSTVIPYDNTIPQNTEGAQLLTVTITPTNSSHILVIEYNHWLSSLVDTASQPKFISALFQDSTANAIYAQVDLQTAQNVQVVGGQVYGRYFMTAGTTSATTFKLRVGPATSSGTCSYFWLQDGSAGAKFSTAKLAVLTVTQWAA